MNTFMRDSGPDLPCDVEPPRSAHTCVPLYRARDGQQALCWCGRDCRDDLATHANVVRLDDHRQPRPLMRGIG